MVKRITMDVHGYKVHFCDRGEVWLDDNDVQYFGNDLDVSMKWDGDKLEILPLTDGVGSITIGDGTTNMDVKIFGNAPSYIHWYQSADTLYLNSLDVRMYHGDFHIGPGQTEMKLYFWGPNDFIQALGPGVLQISASGYINMVSKVTLSDKIQLQVSTAVASALGEMYLDSADKMITYCYDAASAVEFKCLAYNAASNLTALPGKLRLERTASGSTNKGEIWYETSTDKLRLYTTAEEEVVSGAIGGTAKVPGYLQLYVVADDATTTKGLLWCEDAGGKLRWGHGAIVFEAAAVNVATMELTLGGFLRIWTSVNTMGTTTGQVWFNTADAKLRFYDGFVVKTISTD